MGHALVQVDAMTQSTDGRFEYRGTDNEPSAVDRLEQVDRVAFQCRMKGRKPGNWCSVNIKDRGHDAENRNWSLAGTLDAPTLQPSINCGGCWHGFVRDGVFYKTDNATPEATQ